MKRRLKLANLDLCDYFHGGDCRISAQDGTTYPMKVKKEIGQKLIKV